MRNQRIYSRLATEGIEAAAVAPGEEPVVAETTPVEAGADSVEAELVEVNAEVVDLTQAEAETEDAAEVQQEMEVVTESLRDIAKNGGLDRNGARILNLYAASLNRRIGAPANHKILSVESFGGTSGRAETTVLAAESFADKAKELWGKIVEMFKSALNSVIALWNRIFDGATKLKARGEKVLKSLGSVKGDAAGKTFVNQKLAEALHINGTVNAVAAASAINKEASVLGLIAKHSGEVAEKAIAAIEGGADGLSSVLSAAKGMAQGYAKVTDAASVGVDKPGEGLELFKSEPFPGNKAVIAIVPVDGAKAEAVGHAGYKVGLFDASKKPAANLNMPALSAEDAKAVAKHAIDAAAMLLSYKSAQKAAEATAKKVIALAESKAKEAPKEGESTEGKLSAVDARSIARGAMSLTVNSAPPVAGLVLNAGTSVLQYVEQSIKAIGAGDKAAKPAEGEKPAEPKAA